MRLIPEYSVQIQTYYEKIWTIKSPYLDTFNAVKIRLISYYVYGDNDKRISPKGIDDILIKLNPKQQKTFSR